MPEVRRLKPEEASLFRALRLEARASNPEAFRGTLTEEAAKPREWFRERLIHDPVFGAFDASGELIGMAGFTPGSGSRDGPRGRVWTVYVRSSFRGQRIGEALMRAVIDYARGVAPVLHLSVMAANRSGRALYERLGFTLVEIEAVAGPDGYPRDEAHYVLEFRSEPLERLRSARIFVSNACQPLGGRLV